MCDTRFPLRSVLVCLALHNWCNNWPSASMYAFPAKTVTPLVYDFSATTPMLYDAIVNAMSLWIGVSYLCGRQCNLPKRAFMASWPWKKKQDVAFDWREPILGLGPWAQAHEPGPFRRTNLLLVPGLVQVVRHSAAVQEVCSCLRHVAR